MADRAVRLPYVSDAGVPDGWVRICDPETGRVVRTTVKDCLRVLRALAEGQEIQQHQTP